MISRKDVDKASIAVEPYYVETIWPPQGDDVWSDGEYCRTQKEAKTIYKTRVKEAKTERDGRCIRMMKLTYELQEEFIADAE
jgi:hypothetical protein